MNNKLNDILLNVIESISEIVIIFDKDGKILLSNDNATSLFEHTLHNKNIFDIVNIKLPYQYNEHILKFKSYTNKTIDIDSKIISTYEKNSNNEIHILIASTVNNRDIFENQLRELIYQKETYINDIHHKIKNNLQTICSILDIKTSQLKKSLDVQNVNQIKYFKQWEDFIFDVQRKISAISLVHSMLNMDNFNSENSKINFSIYIYNLLEHISELFISNKKIECEYEGEDCLMNPDNAITLGLIINELISNFYKFCLSNDIKNGTIKIKLNEVINNNFELSIIKKCKSDVKYIIDSDSMNLINGFINQINSTLNIKYSKNNSEFKINFINK